MSVRSEMASFSCSDLRMALNTCTNFEGEEANDTVILLCRRIADMLGRSTRPPRPNTQTSSLFTGALDTFPASVLRPY